MALPNEGAVIQSHIDSDQLDRVEQECFELLYQQRLRYNERWFASMLVTRGIPFLRLLGLSVSIFGLALSAFYLLYPSTCPKGFSAEGFLLFFILGSVLFYFLPRINARYHAWLKQLGQGGSRRMARRVVAQARKQVPFDAQYEINGDLIRYSRGRDGQWQQAWSRKLKGFALVGRNAVLLFRKPTSLIPTMLILHQDPEAMASILTGLGLSHCTADK